MNPESPAPEELDRLIRSLAECGTPTDVFKVLLEGSRHAAPRGAIFLIRQGKIKGWGSVGYGSEPSKLQRNYSAPVDVGWLADVTASESALMQSDAIGADLDFGQPPATEIFGLAVRVMEKPIAILVAEHSKDEQNWQPSLLNLLVRVAQLRLDLDLVRRKLHAAAAGGQQTIERPAAAADDRKGAEPQVDAAAAGGQQIVERPAAAADDRKEVEPQVDAKAAISTPHQDPKLDAARRYAKLLATDIRLYNEEAVTLGRRHGDLATRLSEHLDRGKATFLRRHGELGPTALEILHEAYLQVLAGGKAELMPSNVLD
jgi:hypothetical protein